MGGQRVLAGRYQLIEPVGRGGMGTVWRAHDQTLNRHVAVKELDLRSGLDDHEQAVLHERFYREARAAAGLQHPGIVAIHDIIAEDDRPWIVMQLVKGRSLAHHVHEDGPLTVDQTARVGLALLQALDAAHAEGILHRDVTPRNILLADDGRVLLTDFGIAVVAGSTTLTRTGTLMGSRGYVAPERLKGEAPGPKSDLWSLGAALYLAVEGRLPFQSPEPAGLDIAVLTQDPIPPVRAGHLTPTLLGLLARDPEDRWDSARARAGLRDDVKALLAPTVAATAPVQKPPPPPPPPPPADEPSSTPAAAAGHAAVAAAAAAAAGAAGIASAAPTASQAAEPEADASPGQAARSTAAPPADRRPPPPTTRADADARPSPALAATKQEQVTPTAVRPAPNGAPAASSPAPRRVVIPAPAVPAQPATQRQQATPTAVRPEVGPRHQPSPQPWPAQAPQPVSPAPQPQVQPTGPRPVRQILLGVLGALLYLAGTAQLPYDGADGGLYSGDGQMAVLAGVAGVLVLASLLFLPATPSVSAGWLVGAGTALVTVDLASFTPLVQGLSAENMNASWMALRVVGAVVVLVAVVRARRVAMGPGSRLGLGEVAVLVPALAAIVLGTVSYIDDTATLVGDTSNGHLTYTYAALAGLVLVLLAIRRPLHLVTSGPALVAAALVGTVMWGILAERDDFDRGAAIQAVGYAALGLVGLWRWAASSRGPSAHAP